MSELTTVQRIGRFASHANAMLTRAVGAVAIAVRIFERVQNVAQLVGLGYAVAASADSIVVNSGRPVEGL